MSGATRTCYQALATFGPIRIRRAIQQARGLRHTRVPPNGAESPQGTAPRSASMASAYSPPSGRFASVVPSNRRVVSDTLALHPTEPKDRKAPPHGARAWRQPTRHFRTDSHPSCNPTGEWSPTHSRSTQRSRKSARRRLMEREYGVSLLATFEPIRTRLAIQQASGLRHTRAPP